MDLICCTKPPARAASCVFHLTSKVILSEIGPFDVLSFILLITKYRDSNEWKRTMSRGIGARAGI